MLFYLGQTNAIDFEKIARPIGNTIKFDNKIDDFKNHKYPVCINKPFYSITFQNVYFTPLKF